MDYLLSAAGLLDLFTLTFMEIVLGIDNIVFISLITDNLPIQKRKKARFLGLFFALFIRILLLFSITWLIGLTQPLFTLPFLTYLGVEPSVSIRDAILLAGGLFLVVQSGHEIWKKVGSQASSGGHKKTSGLKKSLRTAVLQIIVIDAVFSADSILTAIGLSRHLPIMILAVCLSMVVMLLFAHWISTILDRFESIKLLALLFLVGIGLALMVESLGIDVCKRCLYSAAFFSLIFELLRLRMARLKSQS